MFRYRVTYIRNLLSRKTYGVTVIASDPDDARRKAAALDQEYMVSRTVQRGKMVSA